MFLISETIIDIFAEKIILDKNCEENVRIDKWLWAIRVFKTRSLATDACKNKRVYIDGVAVKPSRTLKVGETVEVRRPPITLKYKVKALLAKRLSAKLVVNYMEDITPQSEFDQLRMIRFASNAYRERGTGRPTKKDRRDMEDFTLNDGWDEMLDDL